jgi:hypothetical protein
MTGLKNAAHTVFQIEKGTVDGVEASLTNTWNFFTRDAWKSSTWKQADHLFDEMALSSSPFSSIYNPNTPILDAGVKSFNDNVVHGDAYTRSKFGAQIATDIATAYVSSKGLGELKSFGSRIIETTWDVRQQTTTVQSIAGYIQAKTGSTLYRLGTLGKSATGVDAQFWSLENPLADPEAYAKKFNVPLENVRNANFVETATLKKGAKFITQEAGSAPGSANAGKGIEIVVEKGGTTNNVITPINK